MKATKILLHAMVLCWGLCDGQRATPSEPKQLGTARTPPAATAPTSPVIVELPHGWTPRKPTVSTVRQMADHAKLQAHFTLALQPRSQFKDDLMAWAKATKKATAQQTKLRDRTESALRESRIHGHSVIEYQISGRTGKYRGILRVFMLPIGDWFCKLTCWTTSDHWDAAQPEFEELIGRLRSTDPPSGK